VVSVDAAAKDPPPLRFPGFMLRLRQWRGIPSRLADEYRAAFKRIKIDRTGSGFYVSPSHAVQTSTPSPQNFGKQMNATVADGQWVWVLVQNPEKEENIVGQHQEDEDISFIPAFLEKEEALKCYHRIARDKGAKDEFQAILFEELVAHAEKNGFQIFVLDGEGKLLERVAVPRR
jgi:hypothetical protein